MATVYLDREDDGRIAVTVLSGAKGKKVLRFTERAEAERFAEDRMGRKGSILSTLDMTPAQLGDHREREARQAARFAEMAERAAQRRGAPA